MTNEQRKALSQLLAAVEAEEKWDYFKSGGWAGNQLYTLLETPAPVENVLSDIIDRLCRMHRYGIKTNWLVFELNGPEWDALRAELIRLKYDVGVSKPGRIGEWESIQLLGVTVRQRT